jgi:hypothetical protein|tara:strand:- start:86 stop:607 length:522 start_codon:yes stop_codon:yes gene_type:complete
MAKSTRTGASYLAESRNTKKKNPFAGMTLAEMKKKYSAMTPAQRGANVETFRAAAKAARKPVAKGGNTTKPKVKGKPPAKDSRFMSSSSQYTGDALDKPKPSGGGQGGRGRQTRSGVTGRVSGRSKTRPRTGQGGRAFARRSGVTNRTSAPSTPRRPRLTAAERRKARRGGRR